MSKTIIGLLGMLIISGVMSISACTMTSPQAVFYTLGTGELAKTMKSGDTACSSKGIGIGPVNWPRYLDQPRIVTRSGPNKLEFNEFHRWGGSLQDDFEQVMEASLSALLQSGRVSGSRITRRFVPDYRVEFDIRQFEGRLGGEVVLDVSWAVVQHKTRKVLGLHESRITQQVSGRGYEALVQASSLAATALSREISLELLDTCARENHH